MAPGVVLLSAIATITNLWTTLLVARGPKKKLLQILRCMTVSQITDEGSPFPSRVQNMHVSFGGGVWSVLTEHFLAALHHVTAGFVWWDIASGACWVGRSVPDAFS